MRNFFYGLFIPFILGLNVYLALSGKSSDPAYNWAFVAYLACIEFYWGTKK